MPTLRNTSLLTAAAALLALGPPPAALASPIEPGGCGEGPLQAFADLDREQRLGSELVQAWEDVAATVGPSVVSIRSVRQVDTAEAAALAPLLGPGFRMPPAEGLGSGFVLDADGYVLTNHHVIEGAGEVTITLPDDREVPARIVGSDPRTDVAVLHIDAGGLQPARLGDGDALRVGQWVAAMGSPFGLSSTMTSGIVSAVGRSRMGITDYEDFIQTDAAINPGNSGGPLVDLHGRVVGMNTAIFTRSGGSMGIGFAIPIGMVRAVAEDLIEHGQVVRGFLGVLIQDLDPDLARSFGHDDVHGALIGDVQPGGPADDAGLQPGDIVLRFAGRVVDDTEDLRLAVASARPGRTVLLEVWRDGQMIDLSVEIGRQGGAPVAVAERPEPTAAERLGLSLRPLSPTLAVELGADADTHGVLVMGVERGGPADRAGIPPRTVILGVQGRSVDDEASFEEAVAEHELQDGIRLQVLAEGVRGFVIVKSDA